MVRRRRPRPLTLTTLVVVLAALGVALVATGGALLYRTAADLATARRTAATSIEPAATDINRLYVDYLDEETGVRGYLLAGQPEYLAPLEVGQADLPGIEAALRSKLRAVPGGLHHLGGVVAAHNTWVAQVLDPAVATARTDGVVAGRTYEESGLGKADFDRLRATLPPLQQDVAAAAAANRAHVKALEARLIALLGVSLGVLVVMIVGIAVLLVRGVALPVARLMRRAVALASGELGAGPEPSRAGIGEVAMLGTLTDTLHTRLADSAVRYQRAREAVAQQSPTVAALEAALAPRIERVPSLEVAARIDPAEGLLAGDWCDLLDAGDGRLVVVVGDVSGHGPESAVVALVVRQVIATHLVAGAAPGDALAHASAAISRDDPERFVTVFCAVVDPGAEVLQYANAGHPGPLVHRDGSSDVEGLAPTGPLLSSYMAHPQWQTEGWPFPPGAGLLAFTDGVIEGRDATGDEYGVGRLTDDLATVGGRPPSEVVTELAACAARFSVGATHDDRTLVYVRSTAAGSAPTPKGPRRRLAA